MHLLIFDAGHGPNTAGKRTPPFPDGRQIREFEFNRPTVDRCIALAKEYGLETFDASGRTEDVPLADRVRRANAAASAFLAKNPRGSVVFVSVHFNAHMSEWTGSTANGIEVFHNPGSTRGQSLAQNVLAELVKGTQQTNRGVKSVAFVVLRDTTMPAILVECGFMDDPREARFMLNADYQQECAVEIVDGVRKYLGIYTEPVKGTPIIGRATATVAQAQAWAKAHNAPQAFIDLAPLYWEIWGGLGLDPAVGYVQFAHETGFLYRNGTSMAGIDATYHNPCGLKITAGGGDTVASAHKRFKDWREGITAHADHAALYAGAPGYPKANSPDPRHFTWIKGVATTLEAFGGRWAPNPQYGVNIRDKFLIPLQQIKVIEPAPTPVKPCACDALKAEIERLKLDRDTLKRDNDQLSKKIVDAIAALTR
jgi:N-acetylmuramoyl-L-alanine amidase